MAKPKKHKITNITRTRPLSLASFTGPKRRADTNQKHMKESSHGDERCVSVIKPRVYLFLYFLLQNLGFFQHETQNYFFGFSVVN